MSVISGNQEQTFLCFVSKSLLSSQWSLCVGSLVSALHWNFVHMGNYRARTSWGHFSQNLARRISIFQYNPGIQFLRSWDPQTTLWLFFSHFLLHPKSTSAPPTHSRIAVLTDKERRIACHRSPCFLAWTSTSAPDFILLLVPKHFGAVYHCGEAAVLLFCPTELHGAVLTRGDKPTDSRVWWWRTSTEITQAIQKPVLLRPTMRVSGCGEGGLAGATFPRTARS